jgi:hypothetical protein
VGRDDGVGSRVRLGTGENGRFLFVVIVGGSSVDDALSSGDGTSEGANLATEVAQLMAEDRVVAFETVNVEAVSFGLTEGKVAVGDGLGELGGEGGGFDREALILDALLLE